MSEMCAQHQEVAAMFRCDGCGKLLCGDCIRKGHALLFCTLCGERALPLNEGQPATVKEVKRHQAVTKPYSFMDALGSTGRASSGWTSIRGDSSPAASTR